ncbi:MAG: response regulator [Calditrichia bacterium]|nr:response regulator [Calditrichia bacterium]
MTPKLKLLIVDDSFIIRQAIKKYLKKYNLEVVGTAENGKVALELFEKTSPDIVTLDITMPEIDGLTVLEEMIKINKFVKVMVVTALTDKATGLKAIKLGAKSYLPKPFTEEKLQESFDRILA